MTEQQQDLAHAEEEGRNIFSMRTSSGSARRARRKRSLPSGHPSYYNIPPFAMSVHFVIINLSVLHFLS